MNPRYSLGAFAVGLAVAGCGLGDDANIGDDSTNQNLGGAGAGSGGSSGGAGGAKQGSGGAVSSGGATTGSGGTVSSGGAATGTGGNAGGVACGKKTCASDQSCCSA